MSEQDCDITCLCKNASWIATFLPQDPSLLDCLMNFRPSEVVMLVKRVDDARSHIKLMESSTDAKQFIHCLISCYCHCLNSPRLAHAVNKLIQQTVLPHFKSDVVQKLMNIFWCALDEKNSANFCKVPSLLQNSVVIEAVSKELGRACESVASVLSILTSSWNADRADISSSRLILAVKTCIQLLQLYRRQISEAVWSADAEWNNSSMRKSLSSIVTCLLHILKSQKYMPENVMLASTALGMMINSAPSPPAAVELFWTLHRFLTADNVSEVVVGKLTAEVPPRTLEQECSGPHILGETAFIQGMIVSSSPATLTDSTPRPSRSDRGENSCPFILELFPLICQLCDGQARWHYHSFALLSQWFAKLTKLLPTMLASAWVNVNLTGKGAVVLEETLKRVWVHSDSPVEGVSDLVGEVFRSLLEVWAAEQGRHAERNPELTQRLSMQLLALPWLSRTKYKLFCVLLPHIRVEELRGAMLLLSDQLLQCMGTNAMAPLAADFYKASLLALRKQQSADRQVCLWRELWEETIVRGLLGESLLQRSKVSEYWVPHTARLLPSCCQLLYQRLMAGLLEGAENRDRVLYSWTVVARVYRATVGFRQEELVSLSEFIEQALSSEDESTCSEAFCLLCDTVKKSEPVCRLELDLLRRSLPFLLKSDSAPFRQQLSADLNKLFVRIRDSCLALLRARRMEEALGQSVEFVEWLHSLLVASLGVGASFQRRRCALDLLAALYNSLLYRPHHLTTSARKGKAQGSTEPLLKYAKSQGLWHFLNPRTTVALLHCILDGADEIQESSMQLLLQHLPWPLEFQAASGASLPSASATEVAEHLLSEALHLSSSPKPHVSQSGAHLYRLIFSKYVLDLGYCFQSVHEGSRRHYKVTATGCRDAALSFLTMFLTCVEESLQVAQQNTVQASKAFPIHGAMQAVIHCLSAYSQHQELAALLHGEWLNFIRRLLDVNTRIVNMMMFILAGGAEKGTCPSFAEMGVALESMVSASQEDYAESTAISPDYQFLLSWCWINLKMSCSCLGGTVSLVLGGAGCQDCPLPLTLLQNIGQVFITVLTNCRHRGAIEGCRHGFLKFCTALLAASCPDVRAIPQTFLRQILTSLQDNAMSTSVTRRSAGLPIVLQCIVQAERKNKESGLLVPSVRELLRVAGQAVPEQADLTTDLPQVHAFNVLKALFADASIAPSLAPHLAPAVCLVIDGFESPSWAVRNSATQLFSTLISRIFGQRSRGESTCNMTLEEFSTHYPELPPFMRAKLSAALEDIASVDKLHPSLFLVLTILASLSPRPVSLQPHSLEAEFWRCVKVALASPIYSVRELAARAYVALVPMETCGESTQSLLQQLSPSTSSNSNWVHGVILSVEKLVLSKKWQDAERQALISALLRCGWLGKGDHCCPLVAAKFFQTMCSLCRHGNLPERQREALMALTEQYIVCTSSDPLKVGVGVCMAESVSLAFQLTQGRQRDAEALCHRCLASSDAEVCSAYLTCLATHLSTLGIGHKLPLGFSTAQRELWEYLARESCVRNLSQAVQLLTDLSLLQARAQPEDPPAWLPPQARPDTLQAVLLHGGSQCSLHQAVLPLQGLMLRQQLQQGQQQDDQLCSLVTVWSTKVRQASSPSANENSRLASAHSLLLAAPHLLPVMAARDKRMEEAAVSLLATCLSLLEEEDASIRAVAAQTVSRLQWTSKPIKKSNLAVGICIKLLFDYIKEAFWWSDRMLNFLSQLLYTPGLLPRRLQTKTARLQHLFEEEDSFYAEPILLLPYVHSTILGMLQRQLKEPGDPSKHAAAFRPQTLCQDLQTALETLQQDASARPVFNTLTDSAMLMAARGLLLASDVCCRCLELSTSPAPGRAELQTLLQSFQQIPFLMENQDSQHA